MIIAENVTKYYGERPALRQLSFEIAPHEVIGFLGLNGAGKTTALKILSGLLMPSIGRIEVFGIDGNRQPRELRRRVGFLPDRPPVYLDMTVGGMLSYAARLNGVSAGDIAVRVQDAMAMTQLEHVANDLVGWLSHGYRQRLGIALAIVHRPQLVILDEPITGLDPEQIIAMRQLVRELAKQHTVLLSSHILREISQTCDRIFVLHQGTLIAQGKESELLAQAQGHLYEFWVRGDKTLVRNVFARQGCGAVEFLGKADEGIHRLQLRIESDEDMEQIVASLVQAGVGIRRVVDASAADIEALFLRLTAGAESGNFIPSASESPVPSRGTR